MQNRRLNINKFPLQRWHKTSTYLNLRSKRCAPAAPPPHVARARGSPAGGRVSARGLNIKPHAAQTWTDKWASRKHCSWLTRTQRATRPERSSALFISRTRTNALTPHILASRARLVTIFCHHHTTHCGACCARRGFALGCLFFFFFATRRLTTLVVPYPLHRFAKPSPLLFVVSF